MQTIFLLISSFTLNTKKISPNRQNDLVCKEDVRAIHEKAVFFDMPHRLLR